MRMNAAMSDCARFRAAMRTGRQHEAADGQVLRHQPPQIDLRLQRPVGRVVGDAAAVPHRSQRRGQIPAQIDIDDVIDAGAAGDFGDAGGDILRAVVHHVGRATGLRARRPCRRN